MSRSHDDGDDDVVVLVVVWHGTGCQTDCDESWHLSSRSVLTSWVTSLHLKPVQQGSSGWQESPSSWQDLDLIWVAAVA